ncbi:MAG: DUF1294 domain-containing protein [Methanospirillum sp.]|uniref:DUF1294 domain-containing protein n=1 Tax=Methanospirillum sp. TaxID=45200 RepID=UPI0023725BEF|nr:DUF1294 domain-containing protein [Methanospirillum sp.]MDD1729877.1 DUF1294 domain-containing protein [Methanospirillum sp.]
MVVQLLPYLEGLYGLVNIVVFLVYGYDKYLARSSRWRISEKKLIFGSFFGPFGAFLGMQVFRHKTQKIRFSFLIPVFMLLHAIIIILLVVPY